MLDNIISEKIPNIQSEGLTKFLTFITHIGDKYTIAIFSLVVIAILLYKKEYIKTKIFTLTMGFGVVFSQLLKYLIERPRPSLMIIAEDGFSFPSGHSTLAMVFFGMMIYLFKNKIKNKTLRYLFITLNSILILSIGFSRIYLNVHWLTDVISGFILGLICIFTAILTVKKIPFLNKNRLL